MEAFNAKLMSLSVAYALSCKVIKYIFTPENILVNRLSVNKTHVVHKTKWQVSSSAESTCKWTPWLAGKGLESTIHSEVEAPRDPQTHNPHWLRRFIQLRHVCCRSISIPRYITKNHIQTLNGSPKKEQVMWVKEERERERFHNYTAGLLVENYGMLWCSLNSRERHRDLWIFLSLRT